ncbi:GLABROUS1 enhancer-binding protein-like [Euphorbia lathyris]|uniref:GLABROUS1 enhancer-binding protein-like n=1 Tax=Euphorbia lathyris TaxID=212925 RepID=UPI003314433E
MAPKRPAPTDIPPVSSSEEEETSSGEEEEVESSAEDEHTEKTHKRAKAVKESDSVIKKVKAEAESESGTESDSESKDVPTLNVKHIASKPMEATLVKSIKPRSKILSSTLVLGKSSTKRGSEVEREAKDKRSKMKVSESNGALEKSEDTKKHLFQRLWSEDDEVTLLNGMIAFIEKKGVEPGKEMSAYYDFIKKSLHFDVALSQLKDKVWKLRKKFENHARKGEKGEGKTFPKPHDQKIFDLSKKIWGSEGICGRSKSSAPSKTESGVGVEEGEKAEKMETAAEMENHVVSKEIPKFDRGMGVATMEEYVIKQGLDMVEGSQKSEMEEKWRKLHEAELELFLKRNELILEQVKLMLAAYKSV